MLYKLKERLTYISIHLKNLFEGVGISNLASKTQGWGVDRSIIALALSYLVLQKN